VKKTNSKKFTIKASVNGEDGTCTFKVRIYSECKGGYAVEFQRREGESTAFHKVFDLASSLLASAAKAFETTKCTASDSTAKIAAAVGKERESSSVQTPQSELACTWPCFVTPGGKAPRGRPGTIEARPKVATATATVDAIESLTAERANAAGSGLSAVRKLSKSALTHPSGTCPPAALQCEEGLRLNTTM